MADPLIEENSIEEYLANAYANAKSSNYAQAISDYTAILKISPDNRQALYNLAWCQVHNGNSDQAIENFTAVIKLEPDNYRAFYFRALAYQDKGDYIQAKEGYAAALEINPDYNEARFARVMCICQTLAKDFPNYWVSDSYYDD